MGGRGIPGEGRPPRFYAFAIQWGQLGRTLLGSGLPETRARASHPPSRPDGRERAPEPIFERISPSSPVRSGGRMGEEGWGDEGQRTEDAESDKVELRRRANSCRLRAEGAPASAYPTAEFASENDLGETARRLSRSRLRFCGCAHRG